jgi:hypothetical protein
MHQSLLPFRFSPLFLAWFTDEGCAIGDQPRSILLLLFLNFPELRQREERLAKRAFIFFDLSGSINHSLLPINAICIADKLYLNAGAFMGHVCDVFAVIFLLYSQQKHQGGLFSAGILLGNLTRLSASSTLLCDHLLLMSLHCLLPFASMKGGGRDPLKVIYTMC